MHQPSQPAEPLPRHTPVLLERFVDLLGPALTAAPDQPDQPDQIVHVDATLGMGGHAEAILRAYPDVRVVGIDRDTQALDLAGRRLADFGARFTGVHAVYDELPDVLADLGIPSVRGILYDLGVSSLHLDEPDRGFAYRFDAPLDMRMDQGSGITAADVLNTYPEAELVRILREYGEERFATKIARRVILERTHAEFTTSGRLVELLQRTIPAATQRTGGHPAKRTFQALRIEVNDELGTWRRALPAGLDALSVGGRAAVMSYHSLEDRITKRAFAAGSTTSAPPDLPVELPEHAPWLRLITKGAEQAGEAELAANPRSAPVRLRVAERIRDTGGASRARRSTQSRITRGEGPR